MRYMVMLADVIDRRFSMTVYRWWYNKWLKGGCNATALIIECSVLCSNDGETKSLYCLG